MCVSWFNQISHLQLCGTVRVLPLTVLPAACLHLPPAYAYSTGASLCATEHGRRLYLVGGHDGRKLLNDCYYLEVERLMWSQINPSGPAPEPREQHVAAVVGKYLFITGGCAAAPAAAAGGGASSLAASGVPGVDAAAAAAAGAAGGLVGKRLTDTYVLDMYTGPAWEQLDDGAWGNNIVWLKQV
jgi:hypothetical protein